MRRLRATAGTLVLVLAVAGVLGAVLAHVRGVRVLPVLTGSMAPAASPGSLVLTVPHDPDEVRVGDVVAFRPPAPFERGGHPVLHRVASVDRSGPVPVMTTKGDANATPDPWRVSLPGADVARASIVVPLVGWVLAGGPRAAGLVAAGLALASLALPPRRPAASCSCGLVHAPVRSRARPSARRPAALLVGAPAAPTAGAVVLPETPLHGPAVGWTSRRPAGTGAAPPPGLAPDALPRPSGWTVSRPRVVAAEDVLAGAAGS